MASPTAVTSAWTEVLGSAPSSFIDFQNQGNSTLRVAIAASSPSAADDGFLFTPGQGFQTTSGLNKVYARSINAPSGLLALRSA